MKFLGKFFNKISTMLLLISAITLSIFIYIVPHSFDWNEHKDEIKFFIEVNTGKKASFDGDVELSSFPYPHLKINNFKLKNKKDGNAEYIFQSESVEIYPSLFKLISGDIELSRVDFQKPVLELENFFDSEKNWGDIINVFSNIPGFGDIFINNGRISYSSGNKHSPTNRTIAVNSRISSGILSSSVSSYGDIKINDMPVKYELDLNNLSSDSLDTKLLIFSGDSRVVLSGNINNWPDKPEFIAKLEASFPLIQVEASGDAVISGNGITSDKIKITHAGMVGEAGVNINFDKIITINSSLSLDGIKIDRLGILFKALPYLYNDFIFRLDADLRDASYNNIIISRIKSDLEAKNGELIVNSAEIDELPGKSSVSISGKLYEEDGLNFSGDFSTKGDNLRDLIEWTKIDFIKTKQGSLKTFDFSGKLSSSQQELHIIKVSGKIDKTDFAGQTKIKFGDGASISAALKASTINLDEYIADNDNPDDLNALSSKFDIIRNIDLFFKNFVVSFSIADLSYKEKSIKDISALARLGNGTLNIENLAFDSEMGKGNGFISIDSRRLNPFISADLKFDLLDMGVIDSVSDKSGSKNKWSEEKFNFDQFNIFSGNIKIAVKDMQHSRFYMKNVKADIDINSGEVDIRSFNAGIFDGNVDIKGRVNTNFPSANLTFSLSNSQIKDFLNSFFEINAVAGRFSMSGSIAMSGNSISSFISSMQGTGNIALRGATVDGVDMLLLSRKIPAVESAKDVRYWIDNSFSSGSSEINYISGGFSVSAGSISLEDIPIDHGLLERSSLTAEIDLPEWNMNLSSRLFIKTRAGSIPTAFLVKGDISDPEISWDKRSVEKFWEANYFGNRRN